MREEVVEGSEGVDRLGRELSQGDVVVEAKDEPLDVLHEAPPERSSGLAREGAGSAAEHRAQRQQLRQVPPPMPRPGRGLPTPT